MGTTIALPTIRQRESLTSSARKSLIDDSATGISRAGIKAAQIERGVLPKRCTES
jgi:hypothetical protein